MTGDPTAARTDPGPPPLLLDATAVSIHTATATLTSGVDLQVGAGRSLALVGESGSGKSVTARALLGLLPSGLSAQGTATIAGQRVDLAQASDLSPLRGDRISLLMQDPFTLLNPLRRVGDQIVDAPAATSSGPDDVARRLAEVGLEPEIARRYPYELSGGMRQRVGIAAALAGDPEVLIADEPTTALDVTTQREVLRLIRRVQAERHMAFVLITHDLRVAFSLCDDVTVLYAGRVVEHGPSQTVRRAPRHPYTRVLVDAEPSLERREAPRVADSGSVPRHDEVADRCGFAARCRYAVDACLDGSPPLLEVDPGHTSACLRHAELADTLSAPTPAARQDHAPDAALTPVLSVSALTKTFPRSPRPAVDGVTVSVAAGECVGIVGESGSGKTTLARCVAGLETAEAGQVILDGTDVSDWSRLSRSERRTARRGLAMVFQDPYASLSPLRRIGPALAEVLAAAGQPHEKRDVDALLDRVGLPTSYARRLPAQLSGGERQRVSIARAVGTRPRLLICDEAVSALDVSVQAQVLALLARLRDEEEMGMLFITHDLAVVRQVADRVVVLRDGHLVEEGATETVLDSPGEDYTRALLASVPREDPAWLV